ncbi:hypothetical protein L9F63_012068 [Diploptera punctata]|uniref:Uncharacterized protein n=1 Tax=Diploptera punctata TaxID=6984 RepID=A0AAD8AD59_DIPPU|nr:hypothetical protein L9F63_012068 [Diploptera punctata]
MKQLQDQLEEKLNSAILMSRRRLRPSAGGEHAYAASPLLEHEADFRKILSVTESTERNFRSELRNLKDELKSFVEEEVQKIQQSDVSTADVSTADVSTADVTQKKLLCRNKNGSNEDPCIASTSDGKNDDVSEKRLKRSSTIEDLQQMDSPLSDNASLEHVAKRMHLRKSVHKSKHRTCSYSSTPQDARDTVTFCNLSTVKRRPRLSGRKRGNDEESTFASSPINVTAIRRSKRLSARNITQDNLSFLNLSNVTTVKRRACNTSVTCINSPTDKNYEFSPCRTSTVRRSERLSLKPTRCYRDETSPIRLPKKTKTKSGVVASPSDLCSKKARDNFKRKVLRMLNGSLKDLTQLMTVGSKTALIIYNYRLLNNCEFKNLEDLKAIPGLASSYYERFMKANNVY